MKQIILRNEFHNTQTKIKLLPNGHVSSKDIDQAAIELCGMPDCTYVPITMNCLQVVDAEGNLYEVD